MVFFIYVPAPIYEWSVKQAGAEIYDICAYEDRDQGLDRVGSVECEECVKQSIHHLGNHGGTVVSDPESSLAVSELLPAPVPPFMVEPYVGQL